MGIDIYIGGYEGHDARTIKEKAAFGRACANRDKWPQGSRQAKAAQAKVSAAYDKMRSGESGYLRSSYNSGGLFNVLDRIFGTDSAQLFFPGEWEGEMVIDWEAFIQNARMMISAGRALRHVTRCRFNSGN